MSSAIFAVANITSSLRPMSPPVGRCCLIPVIVLHRNTSSDHRLNNIEFVSLPIIFPIPNIKPAKFPSQKSYLKITHAVDGIHLSQVKVSVA